MVFNYMVHEFTSLVNYNIDIRLMFLHVWILHFLFWYDACFLLWDHTLDISTLDDTPSFLDINECMNATNYCHSNASCSNSDGSHTCTCNKGYSGNGTHCDGKEMILIGS